MILCRYLYDGEARNGRVENHHVLEIEGDPFAPAAEAGEPVPFSEVSFLAPVAPSKIVAVGLNYREHVKEMGHELPQEPVIFLKPASSVTGPQAPILCPAMSSRVDYEGELGVVIKRKTRNVSREKALDSVLGYTCFNDVTARDLQKRDGQWSRAKGFDSFSPLGPWVVCGLDASDLQIETYVNGELKQKGRTSDMIFGVADLVSFISRVMTLEPGDVIATGTPPGVGPVQPGDIVDVKIDGIGTLRNPVEKADD